MTLTTLRTSSRRTGRRCGSSRPLPETRLAGGLSSGPLSHLEETFPIAGIRGSSKPQHYMWPDPSSTLELIACASWCGIFLCSELNETKSTRYRPCELQISDFENAAVCCFVVLLTRAILRCLTFMTPPLCWKHFHISILGGAPPSFKSSGLSWVDKFHLTWTLLPFHICSWLSCSNLLCFSFSWNLLMPISKIDENMKRAQVSYLTISGLWGFNRHLSFE